MPPTKIYARRSLTPVPPPPAGLTTVPMSALGEEAFGRLLVAACQGDPFDESTADTVVDELRMMAEAAGDRFDADCWYTVHDAQGEVGVLLPQPFPDIENTGTLFYVGVLPHRRGEGLGRKLYELGLSELARRGCTEYLGSTAAANEPMLAIFRAAGCELEEHAAPAPPPADR